MRQVPRYAIIGAGRAATHIMHYFSLLKIPYQQWSRSSDHQSKTIEIAIRNCDRVLLLINDSAIEKFILDNSVLNTKTVIHFSGALVSEHAHGAHPLISFSSDLYDLNTYLKMPFILDNEALTFEELLPGLANPNFIVLPQNKALYHSLCVLSGNFTALLWQKFFTDLESKFKIPKEAAQFYMQRIFLNLQENPKNALSGPFVRNDKTTIAANLSALADDPYQKIYQSFVEVYNECH